MCGLQLTSNHPLRLTQEQSDDTGIGRRLNVLRLRHTFDESEVDVKDLIGNGTFNHELMWLCAYLYSNYLCRLPASGTRIVPRPPHVMQDTGLAENYSVVLTVQGWIEENTVPGDSIGVGTSSASVKSVIANALELEAGQVDSILAAAGLKQKRNGAKRCFMYMYPLRNQLKSVIYPKPAPEPA